jgi:hypothetical protein
MFWKSFNSIIVPLFVLVPIIIGLMKYKFLPKELKIICYVLIITALINTAATIVGRVFHTNNLPLAHLFTLVEGVMLIMFYEAVLKDETKHTFFLVVKLIFITFCLANAFFLQNIFTYNSYTKFIESVICILFTLNYFAKIAVLEQSVKRMPLFYFNAGIFLYFSGSFILFIFSNILLQNLPTSTLLIFWSMHSTMIWIMYCLFSIGFILCKK